MAELKFQISQGSECDKIEFINCSEYCNPVTYAINYCMAKVELVERRGPSGFTYFFVGGYEGDGTVSTHTWTLGAQVVSTPNALLTLTASTTNTITYAITDSNGLTSTSTFKVTVNATGVLQDYMVSGLDMTAQANAAGPANYIYFVEDNTASANNSPVSVRQISYGDAVIHTTMPRLKDYGTTSVTRTGYYHVIGAAASGDVTATFQIKISSTSVSCAQEITEDNLTEITLTITNPDGDSDTLDITDYFFDSPFYLDEETFGEDGSDEFDSIDFSTPGVYKFQVIVTKVDGGTYILSECISVAIICSIRCAYDSLLYSLTQEDCDTCVSTKMDQTLEMYMYIKALENAIACADTIQINKLIDVLDGLADGVACDC